MADYYVSEDAFLADYRKLTPAYQDKVGRYTRKLLQIQRAEQNLTAEIHHIEWKRKSDGRDGIKCSFCGKHQDDCERIIAGPQVLICDECARLCGQVLDDLDAEERVEKQTGKRGSGDEIQ